MSEEFIDAIKQYINYWVHQDRTEKEKMEGLAFSILCMLDGVSGSFKGNIDSLSKEGSNFMLHDQFYEKEKISRLQNDNI